MLPIHEKCKHHFSHIIIIVIIVHASSSSLAVVQRARAIFLLLSFSFLLRKKTKLTESSQMNEERRRREDKKNANETLVRQCVQQMKKRTSETVGERERARAREGGGQHFGQKEISFLTSMATIISTHFSGSS